MCFYLFWFLFCHCFCNIRNFFSSILSFLLKFNASVIHVLYEMLKVIPSSPSPVAFMLNSVSLLLSAVQTEQLHCIKAV